MTCPETLHMKITVNECSFPLVTHTAYFNTRFGRYGLLKTEHGAELFQTAWTLQSNPSFRGQKQVNLCKA
jgi:hypothetical protein